MNVRKAMLVRSVDSVDPGVRRDALRIADEVKDASAVGQFVRSILADVAAGEQVIVLRADQEVSPAEAARIIGVTRQYVDRLCEDEILPFHRLPGSRHRRIRVADVIAVLRERDRLRAGHEALRTAMIEAGLSDS